MTTSAPITVEDGIMERSVSLFGSLLVRIGATMAAPKSGRCVSAITLTRLWIRTGLPFGRSRNTPRHALETRTRTLGVPESSPSHHSSAVLMKRLTPALGVRTLSVASLIASGLSPLGCEAADNLPPSVSILWPTHAFFSPPAFVQFQAAATDAD